MNLVKLFIENLKYDDNVYIRGLGTYVKNLLNKLGIRKLRKILNTESSNIYSWTRQGIPVKKIKDINELYIKQFKKPIPYYNAYFSVIKSPHNIKLPLKLSSKLCYLVGYLIGDGTIRIKNNKEYRIEFDDISKDFLLSIAKIIIKIFNINKYGLSKDRIHNCYCLRFNSKLLVLFFIIVFKIPSGKKKNKIKIPELIRKSKFLKDFVCGFFDAEGSIYYNPKHYYYNIVLTQKDKRMLKEIKDILQLYGIPVTRLTDDKLVITRKQNFLNFISKFKLKHPDKISRIKLALKRKSTVIAK